MNTHITYYWIMQSGNLIWLVMIYYNGRNTFTTISWQTGLNQCWLQQSLTHGHSRKEIFSVATRLEWVMNKLFQITDILEGQMRQRVWVHRYHAETIEARGIAMTHKSPAPPPRSSYRRSHGRRSLEIVSHCRKAVVSKGSDSEPVACISALGHGGTGGATAGAPSGVTQSST